VCLSYGSPEYNLDAGPSIDNIPLASLDTLAALKCHGIANRGACKDFIDLYAFLQAGWDFSQILEAINRHAPSLNIAYLLRSMVHFRTYSVNPAFQRVSDREP